jgi:hypothetical protein
VTTGYRISGGYDNKANKRIHLLFTWNDGPTRWKGGNVRV